MSFIWKNKLLARVVDNFSTRAFEEKLRSDAEKVRIKIKDS